MKQIFLSSLFLVLVTVVLLNIKLLDKLSAGPTSSAPAEQIKIQLPTTPLKTEADVVEPIPNTAISYSVPKTATVDDPFNVVMKIDPSKTVDKIKLSQIINAQLNVDEEEFKLVNLSTNEQALFVTEPNVWEWELTALKAGTSHISLGITAIVTINNKQTNHFIESYSNDIVVTSTTKQQLKDLYDKHKDKLWGFLVVPVFEWARRKFNKWKEEREAKKL